MRCDMCPLCPTAEDDACAIADTEYGIEHKDGMSGCRHPYNWCKKKADEYADHLGEMGRQMGLMWDAEQKGFKEGYEKGKAKMFDELKLLFKLAISEKPSRTINEIEAISIFRNVEKQLKEEENGD